MRSNLARATACLVILACVSGWAGMHRVGPDGKDATKAEYAAAVAEQQAAAALVTEQKAYLDWQALEADPAAKQADKTKAKGDWQAAHTARKAKESSAAAARAAAKAAKATKTK